MAQTKIEWTWTLREDGSFAPGYTFNPWLGCTKVAPGCAHCYAEALMDTRWGKVSWGPNGTRVRTTKSNWNKPLQWDKEAKAMGERRKVFCASLADVFEDWQGRIVDSQGLPLFYNAKGVHADKAPAGVWCTMDHLRADLFKLIDRTPNLDWLLLTKRPENIKRMWSRPGSEDGDPGRRNVWLGASISEQETADEVIPELWKCRDLAPVLWLSAEPLLGPADLSHWLGVEQYMPDLWRKDSRYGQWPMVDWVVVGGESGADRREFHSDWAREMRDQCAAAGVAYFFKQVDKVQRIPEDLMIREFPKCHAVP